MYVPTVPTTVPTVRARTIPTAGQYVLRAAIRTNCSADVRMILFERSEFLIATSQKQICTAKKICTASVCSTNLGFSVEKNVLVLVWGTYFVPDTYVRGTSERLVANCRVGQLLCPRAASCLLL